MKAVEYFEKYQNKLNKPEDAAELFLEMSKEVEEIAKQRNAVSDEAAIAIMKELNQKWNSLRRMFLKKLGSSILIENAFMVFWKKEVPSLNGEMINVS
jgi:hypothetical protein